MEKQKKQEETLKIIRMFRERELLWNMNSFSYRHNDLKKKALEEIGNECNMSEECVKKKLKSLRSTYVIEKKKVEHSIKSGCDPAEVYEPSLSWFEEMSFLDSSITTRKLKDNVTNDEGGQVRKKFKKNSEPAEELILLASERLKTQPDNFKKMADVWAAKLRQMKPAQQLYAEKFVNEIMFEGVLGNLNRNSVQIIPTRTSMPNAFHHSTLINIYDSPADSLDSFDTINNQQTATSSGVIPPVIAYPVSIKKTSNKYVLPPKQLQKRN